MNQELQETFKKVFETKHWTEDGDVSVSGSGSEIRNASVIAAKLKDFIDRKQVKTVVDAPCGDYNWQHLFKTDDLLYIGYDIVHEVIDMNIKKHYGEAKLDFAVADITVDKLPIADLVIVRDCLVHLSFEDGLKALKNIASQDIKYLAVTHFGDRKSHHDTTAPVWRFINLQLEPYNMPEPVEVLIEECKEANGLFPDKSLAIFTIEQLRSRFNLQ